MKGYSTHAAVMQAYYRQHAARFISGEFLARALQPANGCSAALAVGSYTFAVAPYLTNAALAVVADLSFEMLVECTRGLPMPSVQCDVRALPFVGAFDVVTVLGGVTAHLHREEDLQAFARSVGRAVRKGGVVVVDAYDASTIANAGYFTRQAAFEFADQRWNVTPSMNLVSIDPRLYSVSLCFRPVEPCEGSGQACGFDDVFLQRCFAPEELSEALVKAGLVLASRFQDRRHGRLYLALVRE